jgi:hypothetical protein
MGQRPVLIASGFAICLAVTSYTVSRWSLAYAGDSAAAADGLALDPADSATDGLPGRQDATDAPANEQDDAENADAPPEENDATGGAPDEIQDAADAPSDKRSGAADQTRDAADAPNDEPGDAADQTQDAADAPQAADAASDAE